MRCMLRAALFSAFCLYAFAALGQNTRHFTFRYEFTVKNVPAGQPVRVWIPLAHSDEWQTVRVVKTTGDLPLRRTREAQYGNTMLYAEAAKPTKAEYHFAIDYDVVRREHMTLSDAERRVSEDAGRVTPRLDYVKTQQPPGVARFLKPDRLVPLTGEPADIAKNQVARRTGELQKARALYDYVLTTMKYDKTGDGWGRGDALWACDSKRGNCTDFHSLFMSMARSQQIPSRFEIGFPLPASTHQGEIPGYHCWAEFYLYGKGWVPVDISEAWKDANRREYFFGAHDVNRVQFTLGRDITLSPPQAGEPLNYFVYPYVEVAGKEYGNIVNNFTFMDVSSGSAQRVGN